MSHKGDKRLKGLFSRPIPLEKIENYPLYAISSRFLEEKSGFFRPFCLALLSFAAVLGKGLHPFRA